MEGNSQVVTGSGRNMHKGLTRVRLAWWLSSVPAIILVGCSLFGLGGGPKERALILKFVAADKLNFDGTSANPVQVAVFVLSATERFKGGRVEMFFDDDFDRAYLAEFAQDTVAKWMFTIKPGQTESRTLRYKLGPSAPKRVYLGVIGDFFRPSEDGRQRAIHTLRNTKTERLTITMGENYIESVTR